MRINALIFPAMTQLLWKGQPCWECLRVLLESHAMSGHPIQGVFRRWCRWPPMAIIWRWMRVAQ